MGGILGPAGWRSGPSVKLQPAGYSGTPLAKKLGIVPGSHVATRHAPADYGDLLEPLPDGVVFDAKVAATTDVVHVFADRKSVLEKELGALRKSHQEQWHRMGVVAEEGLERCRPTSPRTRSGRWRCRWASST